MKFFLCTGNFIVTSLTMFIETQLCFAFTVAKTQEKTNLETTAINSMDKLFEC